MKIAVVYGNDGSDVRIAKTCATLVKLGHEVHFIGWNRRPHVEKDASLPGVTSYLVQHPVPKLGSTWSGQLAFSQHAIKTLWKLRPEVVSAVNEDNVIRVGWLKHIAFRKLVCDVFDSHIDKSTNSSLPVRAISYLLANASRWWSDQLIATDELRYQFFGRYQPKTIVVGNYPTDPGPEWAKQFPMGPPKLFVSGTLSKLRGIEQVVAAAEQMPELKVIAAGWAADEYASDVFLKHPNVEFLGHITPRQSLEIGASCDAFLAMYAPTTRNHIFASPNKIYDAISVGRPVIINSEAKVSEWVRHHNVGFTPDYADANALAGYLKTLVQQRAELPEFAQRARTLFQSGYSWESMERRIAEMYTQLGAEHQRDLNTQKHIQPLKSAA